MKSSKMKLCAFGLSGVLVAMGILISADIAFEGTITARAENDDQTLLNQIENELLDKQGDDEFLDDMDSSDDTTPDINNGSDEEPLTNNDDEPNSDEEGQNQSPDEPLPGDEKNEGEIIPEETPTDSDVLPPDTNNQETGHMHQYNYTDNGDGTHTKWCADTECGSSEVIEHSYRDEDHLCECGASDPAYTEQNQTDGEEADIINPDTPAEPEKSFEFSEDQYNSMNAEIDTLNKEISNLTNQLNTYKNSVGKTTVSTGNNNSAAVSSLSSQVSNLQSKNSAMQSSVSSLSNANATLQSKNNTLTSEITALKSQLTALTNQLNSLKNSNTTPTQPVVKSNTTANASSTVNNQRTDEGFQDSKAASVTNIQNLVETTTDTASVSEENTVETFDMSLNTLSDEIYFDFSDNEVPEELVSTSQSTSTAKYQSSADTAQLTKNTLSKKRMKDNQTIMVAGCVAGFATLMLIILMIFGFKSGVLGTKKNKSLELEDDEPDSQSDIEHSSTNGTDTPIIEDPARVAEPAV